MKSKWLRRSGSDRVILFWNGWGMDEQIAEHMVRTGPDVVTFWDFQTAPEHAPALIEELREYTRIDLIAWSLGVWAAAETLPLWDIPLNTALAVNGTTRPVDERFGIAPRIFEGTLHGWREESQLKFYQRIAGKGDADFFMTRLPSRSIAGQKEELSALRKRILDSPEGEHRGLYTGALLSRQDRIFPLAAQKAHWQELGVTIRELDGPHYPFAPFSSFEEVLALACCS